MHFGTLGQRNASRLWYILLGGWVVLFAANFMLHDSRGLGTGADSFKYLTPAVNLARGLGYTYLGHLELYFPPGYGLRTLPLYLLGFEPIQAALIGNVIVLALACLFAYLICRLYVSRVMALVAILFVVMNTYIMEYTALAMSEVTFMAGIAGAGYFVLRFIRQPRRNPLNLAAAGVFVSCAALTRPEGIGTAIVLLGFLLVDLILRQPPRLQSGFVGRLAFYALVFAAPAIVVYSPYVVFLSKNLGHFTVTNKAEINYAFGDARTQPEYDLGNPDHVLQEDLYVQQALAQGIHSTFEDGLRRLRINLARYASYAVRENLAPLAALGLVVVVGLWRTRLRRLPLEFRNDPDLLEALGFCIVMFAPLVPMAYYLAEPRMFVPFNMFVTIGAVVLMDRLVAAPSSMTPLPIRPAFALAIAGPLLLLGAYSNIAMSSTNRSEYHVQNAAIALAGLTQSRPVNVMALRRAEVASYYANDRRILPDAKFVRAAPDISSDQVAETMRSEGLTYLLLDRHYIRTRPGLASLWACTPDACPASLRLVAERPGEYRIFELAPASG
jgi:hypothetical protein